MIELNPLAHQEAERTYVLFGAPRGGTTMLAGISRLLGLYIGDNLPGNLEDPLFTPPFDSARFAEHLALRDAAHPVWGWKFPRAVSYLPHLQAKIRNPYYVCIFRDYVATSSRKIRAGMDVLERLTTANHIYRQNLKFLQATDRPCLVLSYEKTIARPEDTARALSNFLRMGTDADVRRACEFVKPGDYQDPTASARAAG